MQVLKNLDPLSMAKQAILMEKDSASLLPWHGLGLAIGVGTGRFAAPLRVQVGIDPAHKVQAYATKRGISSAQAIAEALPFTNNSFDCQRSARSKPCALVMARGLS
ncbi:methyltransferase domain-containing protein [Nitrosococcus wardiae]|uniref:Methyltransferase domain-containing protein n=1 Tax=Nitrosococcus wardiae TaxID=1814290 RepID=A0A4P7C448_9GAMM|nr:methyltransferase domain-containing protein [Nitrosococcus wardiae]QBQ55592.1 methyltransferase domain-containing protein [Nitrosococcus wardiae]